MTKPKKALEQAKAGATLEIDVDSFVRTRDSVVTGLATLQDAIQELSTAYIKHTNLLLGEHGTDIGTALSKLGENPLLGPLANLQRAVSPAALVAAAAEGAPDKKERKKRLHDPNAPKRPLTPFFLYMQTARPIIAKDLGESVPKGAVSDEGTRRWKEMEETDRTLWSNAYKDNLRLYNARMHSYKHEKNLNAKDMTEQEAILYAEEHNIGADNTADAQLVGEAAAVPEADADGEPEKEPTPPPKTPKAKAAGRKAKKGTPAEIAPAPAPTSSAPIVPAAAPASEKKETPAASSNKRKRAKKGEEPAAETEEAPKSTPKPRQKKKAKAEA